MRSEVSALGAGGKHDPHCADLLAEVTVGRSDAEQALIRQACAFAERAHQGQTRASGEAYIGHPLAVASLLNELRLDHETIAAAILHDVVEDTPVELGAIREAFGEAVARLVDGVTKMDVIGDYAGESTGKHSERKQLDRLRKLLVAMVEDVRVVLIKLADRLHNMRTLRHLDPARRRRIAQETLDIYAPLASRLGIWQIKWEMEDLSFRYLEPETYVSIARHLDERRVDRERYIGRVLDLLGAELAQAGVSAEVSGRPKHIYSIWRKMRAKGLDFHQLFDVRALRVLVPSVADCYAALGVVHTLWQFVPGEFDDYITNPKRNNYRSLHTAVIGPEGRTLEVQIRTHEMHASAELGVAAHWRYKDGSARDPGIDEKITWLRQVIEAKEAGDDPSGLLERFQTEVLHERVYVFTPQGRVMDLPKGSTPLDFAYSVHTDVGHRCRGAKVNGAIVPLTYELKTGENVEVLTTRAGVPSRDWLNPNLGYLRTARARSKVRHWFKQQDHDKNLVAGREVYERELKRLGIREPDTERLLKRFNFARMDDLLAALGHGTVTTGQIASALQEGVPRPADSLPRASRPRNVAEDVGESVRVMGVGKLLSQMARCYKPVPYDPIVGFITRGRGVTIHRRDCRNVLRLRDEERRRLIDVDWSAGEARTYPVQIQLSAYDRQGLLRDVSTVLANERANVRGIHSHTDPSADMVSMRITLEVSDLSHLSRVLDRLGQLPNVVDVGRHD